MTRWEPTLDILNHRDRSSDSRSSSSISRSKSSERKPRSPSHSSSTLNNGKDSTYSCSTLGREDSETREEVQTPDWIPYAFRASFLSMLSLVALVLSAIIFLLFWRSLTNYGLGRDDGSSMLLFGWRFSPTLIAVIYIQLTAMLFEDVERTEPFARLARTEGAEASASLLQRPGAWWNALYDGLSGRKGGRSWALFCAALVNFLGFLAISPLSSAFLFSKDAVVPRSIDFARLTPLGNSPLPLDAGHSARFRTISSLLQNVSTSPWITDNYTVFPFWPAFWQTAPLSSLPSTSETWHAETMVFKSNLHCTPMLTERESTTNVTWGAYGSKPTVSILWSSIDGCKYGLEIGQDENLFKIGGGSWSNTSTFFNGEAALNSATPMVRSNQTAQCKNREILIVTEPWTSDGAKYSAQLCESSYAMANLTASMTLSSGEPQLSFDEDEFHRKKVPIPDNVLNATQFQDLTLNADWSTYMVSIIHLQTAILGGPSILLGALYDYNMTALVRDPNMIVKAAKAKQRYFGEVLQSALTHPGASQKTTVLGQVYAVERRVVVVAGSAIALGVLFFLSFCLVITIWQCARLQRRPLNLRNDPATTAGVTSLVMQNPRTRASFQPFNQSSAEDLQIALAGKQYYTDSEGLSGMTAADDKITAPPSILSPRPTHWTPALLRLPALLALSVLLVIVVIGIAVLFHFAEKSGLYQKAFVYQIRLTSLNKGPSSVAPFSMIPTVIAVAIGLWWGAIDDRFRRLQPFLSMSKGSQPLLQGVFLSYQSSYWLFASVKAGLNRHWLLFLVTFGTSLSPLFTTTMSALFQHGPGVVTKPVTLERQLEIRDIPLVFRTGQATMRNYSNDYAGSILADFYQNLSAHWMYTATIQLTLNGSEPAWSKDGWSFVPADLSNIKPADSLPNGDVHAAQANSAAGGSQTNVSFTTTAIRARIECTQPPVDTLRNLSNWLTPTDLGNSSVWNGSTIPDDLAGGWQLGTTAQRGGLPRFITPLTPSQNWTECPGCTTMFVNPSQVVCCKNGGSSSSDPYPSVAVGYWSPNSKVTRWTTRDWQHNFTAKWVHGSAVSGVRMNDDVANGHDIGLLFPRPPSLTLLNCMPLVETADAEVAVNPTNGEIQAYHITSKPEKVANAFSDNFVPRNGSFDDGGVTYYNTTLSYGQLFMASMLTAADTLHIQGAPRVGSYNIEDLKDNTYNIRDEMHGLNMDFMTYAMYSMANKDPAALLDADLFTQLATKTFTTFFQHFVSNNVSTSTGGWAYQRVNASLPQGLGPAVEDYLPGAKILSSQKEDNNTSSSSSQRKNNQPTIAAHISHRVELLQMNAVAVWLSIGILAWLILTTAIIAGLQRRYFRSLARGIECLADLLVLVAGSSQLLGVIDDLQSGRVVQSELGHLRTRLGWFVGDHNHHHHQRYDYQGVDNQPHHHPCHPDGEIRWGIEVEQDHSEGGVDWVSGPGELRGSELGLDRDRKPRVPTCSPRAGW
ncbi:hypothetical protein NUU61_007868 [Penicillium alfredii]|uniref:Uncharacterized protein n=1 Tax=Penicillium alfredii TaxID=1506179 RepID=A0A9W9ERK2_9EURO|nr:uncharacterized protein NUU61_007868 [Penicillium alfredii]KAJ5086561.1 hypothetical protein NUU61_007868 [Penicillium alfredii]